MTRMSVIGLMVGAVVAVALPVAAQDTHAAHAVAAQAAPQAAPQIPAPAPGPRNPNLPAGEEQAKAALETSPRHGEYVDVPVAGSTPVRAWVVYPERKDKAPVVVVIHEIFGLSDWIRGVADQLAREGFIAIAPDLISGKGPNGGGTDAVPSKDDVVKLVRELAPEEVKTRLDAVRSYGITLPAANGKSATVGYCWGGATSFRYATEQPALNAAVVYYGTSPDTAALGKTNAAVLGLYGSDDARVNATIDAAEAELKKLGKTYEKAIYDGAGHGFLRAQTGRDGANMTATEQAWPRTIEFLKAHTK
jgi:carboxymethylenebutenolidase